MSRTDRYYVRRCLAGEAEQYVYLVSRYQGPVLGYLSGLLGDQKLAEQAAAETFALAYTELGKSPRWGAFVPWLAGLAARVARDVRKRLGSHTSLPASAGSDTPGPPCDHALRAAVSELPPVCRNAVLLRFHAGLSRAEVASRLDLSVEALDNAMNRAFALLGQAPDGPADERPDAPTPTGDCASVRTKVVVYLDEAIDEEARRKFEQHLDDCDDCRQRALRVARLHGRLASDGLAAQNIHLADTVMGYVRHHGIVRPRRVPAIIRYPKTAFTVLAVAVATVALGVLLFWTPETTPVPLTAAEVLTRAADKSGAPRSVRLTGRIRGGDFRRFDADELMTPLTMQKRFLPAGAWRVQTPDQVAVMNAAGAVLWIKPDLAYTGGMDSDFAGWPGALMNISTALRSELLLSGARRARLSRQDGTGPDGKQEVVVTVHADAQVKPFDGWLREPALAESPTRRVYRFNAETLILNAIEVYLGSEPPGQLVLEITSVRYDLPLDDEVFSLRLPESVLRAGNRPPVPPLPDNEKYAAMPADEVLRTFFTACAAEDWDEAGKFWLDPLDDDLKKYLGGLEIVRVSKALTSSISPKWYVDYTVRLKTGIARSGTAAMRNDNPVNRWFIDSRF